MQLSKAMSHHLLMKKILLINIVLLLHRSRLTHTFFYISSLRSSSYVAHNTCKISITFFGLCLPHHHKFLTAYAVLLGLRQTALSNIFLNVKMRKDRFTAATPHFLTQSKHILSLDSITLASSNIVRSLGLVFDLDMSCAY